MDWPRRDQNAIVFAAIDWSRDSSLDRCGVSSFNCLGDQSNAGRLPRALEPWNASKSHWISQSHWIFTPVRWLIARLHACHAPSTNTIGDVAVMPASYKFTKLRCHNRTVIIVVTPRSRHEHHWRQPCRSTDVSVAFAYRSIVCAKPDSELHPLPWPRTLEMCIIPSHTT